MIDGGKVLKMEMYKMAPKFLIDHMVDRDTINRDWKDYLRKGKGDDAKPDLGQIALEAPAAGCSVGDV